MKENLILLKFIDYEEKNEYFQQLFMCPQILELERNEYFRNEDETSNFEAVKTVI